MWKRTFLLYLLLRLFMLDWPQPSFGQGGATSVVIPSHLNGSIKAQVPIRDLEQVATSVVELTCLKAYKENMQGTEDKKVTLIPIEVDGGYNWCEAMDESELPTQLGTFRVLIRMRIYYTGPISKNNEDTNKDARLLLFYVIASRSIGDPTNRGMDIISILPRISCNAFHRESVKDVAEFISEKYFLVGGKPGCHDTNFGRDQNLVSRITFTGKYTNHMFLFGASLIQSTDAGGSFFLLSFPVIDGKTDTEERYPQVNGQTRAKIDPLYQIEVMAFSADGHYAFLTNTKDLWIGSTGDVTQFRLRPSRGNSMLQTMVWENEGIENGLPFSLEYDAHDVLHEIVIVANASNQNQQVMRRRVPVDLMRRYQIFSERLEGAVDLFYQDLKDALGTVDPKREDYPDYAYPDPFLLSSYCPTSTTRFYENYAKGVTIAEKPDVKAPTDSARVSNDHPAKWALHVAADNVEWKVVEKLKASAFAPTNFNPDQFDRWILERQDFAKIGQLRFISGEKLTAKSQGNRLLTFYYLDYGTTLRLEIIYNIKSDAVVGDSHFAAHRIVPIQLNVDNPNGTLLNIETEKVDLYSHAAVKFIVDISVIRSSSLVQNPPGVNLIPYRIGFHLINRFEHCTKRLSDPFLSDSHSTLIQVGCRPATEIMFNWNQTLYSIKFKDPNAHYGHGDDDCYESEFVCFFARAPLVLHFNVYDIAKQTYVPYEGNYVMRVIAGGYKKDDMVEYTQEQQEGYNVPGTSDVSLIWNEWDLLNNQKLDRPPAHFNPNAGEDKTISNRERVLKAGVSAIQWACHTLSPCARVVPNSGFQTVFWFRIFVSNRGVENNTLCLYERKFDMMLYGFPPSPETQLFTTIVFCLCILSILYVFFICLRGHKRVWRATKLKMSGWVLIVRDTFPKALKSHEEQNQEEVLSQQQKDNIILSLQGHLKIPALVARGSTAPAHEFKGDTRGSVVSQTSSHSSIRSGMSLASGQEDILDKAAAAAAPNTWTDMVYEQIISKRLTAIVDKNKKMRANILRRTSLHDTSIQQEKRYEQEHKTTVAEESMFTGKPKK